MDEGAQTTKSSLDAVDNIYKTVVGTGDKPGRIREFFKLLDEGVKRVDPQTGKSILTKAEVQQIREKIQGQFFVDTFKKTTDKGVINPQKVLDILSGKTGPGSRVLNEMFKGNKDVLKSI